LEFNLKSFHKITINLNEFLILKRSSDFPGDFSLESLNRKISRGVFNERY